MDLPLSDEADRQFKSGPSFWTRYLPYWAAVMVERLLVTLVPAVAIMVAVIRHAPTILGWRVRQKILHWYGELQMIERQARAATTPGDHERIERHLQQVERGVGELSVALGSMESLYELRRNVQLAAQRLSHDREAAGTLPTPRAAS